MLLIPYSSASPSGAATSLPPFVEAVAAAAAWRSHSATDFRQPGRRAASSMENRPVPTTSPTSTADRTCPTTRPHRPQEVHESDAKAYRESESMACRARPPSRRPIAISTYGSVSSESVRSTRSPVRCVLVAVHSPVSCCRAPCLCCCGYEAVASSHSPSLSQLLCLSCLLALSLLHLALAYGPIIALPLPMWFGRCQGGCLSA
jgi:hypothetical protein